MLADRPIMIHRSRTSLLIAAFALSLAGCAKQAAAPAPASTPAPPLPAQKPRAPAPAAPPAGQSAPSSQNQQFRAPQGGPSSLSAGEKKKAAAPEFNNVADAEAALARANRELVALYQPRGGGATQQRATTSKSTRGAAPRAASPMADNESRCATACKAFASLQRAADAVCRLAGEDDARCAHAKKLVDENSRRVAQCGCQH